MTFDVTESDVREVLTAHGVATTGAGFTRAVRVARTNRKLIRDVALLKDIPRLQSGAYRSAIEDVLTDNGVLEGEKRFRSP